MTLRFQATLRAQGRGGHAVALTPAQVRALQGRPHTRVQGTVNGAPLRSSIFPYGGVYYLLVHKATVQAAGAAPGKRVALVLARDDAPRTLAVPPELARAIRRAGLRDAWDRLSFTHRKEHAAAVREAKRPETRERRIAAALAALRARRAGPARAGRARARGR